jgi:NDP-sugar pyrophosphorylase family protein
VKALVFAAGLGTRLKPFTLEHPKALVPVVGVPMLGRVITKLADYGVTEIVVNVHHFAQQVIDYINQNDFGVTIHISDESTKLLDTGGGVLKAREWLDGDEPFIVHNADVLTDFDVLDMYKAHTNSAADATLLCAPRQTARYFFFNNVDNRLMGWANIQTGETRPTGFAINSDMRQLAFNGVHIMSPKIFETLEKYSASDKFSISQFYIDNVNNLTIQAYCPNYDYLWLDVGKPETLEQANKLITKL